MIEPGDVVICNLPGLIAKHGSRGVVLHKMLHSYNRCGSRWMVEFPSSSRRRKPYIAEIYEKDLRKLSPLERLAEAAS